MSPSPATVLAAWRRRRPRTLPPSSGHGGADDDLISALLAGDDARAALEAVAADRYLAGYTFSECLADIRALLDSLPAPAAALLPPFEVADLIGRTFVDGFQPEPAPTLSGLPGPDYLIERAREARRRREPAELVIVAVAGDGDRFTALLDQLAAAPALIRSMPDAMVIADIGPGRFVALCHRGDGAPSAAAAHGAVPGGVCRARVTPLPEDEADLRRMLRSVTDQRTNGTSASLEFP